MNDLQEFLSPRLPTLKVGSHGTPYPDSVRLLDKWLKTAVRHLSGFENQPCVVRHAVKNPSISDEIRRRSEDKYLQIGTTDAYPLLVNEEGRLFIRELDGQRVIHPGTNDELIDNIFKYTPIDIPQPDQLEQIRCLLISKLYKVGYSNWSDLSGEERAELVSREGGGPEAALALELLKDGDQIETLELFVSEKANKNMQKEIWLCGAKGELSLNAGTLGWFLRNPDWSGSDNLQNIAKHIVSSYAEEASRYILHPNSAVRLHLADLIDNADSLLDWLKIENVYTVRHRILMQLQTLVSVQDLVMKLKAVSKGSSPDKELSEVIGWVLANWTFAAASDQDLAAFAEATGFNIGKANIQALKTALNNILPL
ncbi:hypothetical protein IJT93_03685 [bacterium]|nr:hypothetical protein [bacterium]